MSVSILRGDARHLPLEDDSVDLVCTSPPYHNLRSYQDGGQHYEGQIGSEPTAAEFIDALIDVTRELMRVTKPSGSIFVNLGDRYSDKTLLGLPWRYAIRCIDDLGLILRAEVIWSKPNGLPESVTDRVRRSHEQWFHFTLNPRYYSAVDEIREAHDTADRKGLRTSYPPGSASGQVGTNGERHHREGGAGLPLNPLGKLPGSVWTVPTQPLTVPAHLGVDHFAAFPMEWPRRIVSGWSPRGVCEACGEGRRPVVTSERVDFRPGNNVKDRRMPGRHSSGNQGNTGRAGDYDVRLTGEACACPDTTAPTRPGVVLDPFGGTGTTALVAHALGRHGISVDMSADYCRLAEWRTSDPGQIAAAMQVEKPAPVMDGQLDIFGEVVA